MEDVKWIARIELLSPLHIGTGTKLLEGIDWIQSGGHVYVANQDVLLEAVFDRAGEEGRSEASVARAIAGMTLKDMMDAGYLTKEDFAEGSSLFRYRLKGGPAMNQIGEQIKDVFGRPYLPGSSLKGALRTVLAVGGATVQKLRFESVGRSRSWAAQPVERELFGCNPNYDLLRALQVSDSGPVGAECLGLERVNIYPTAGKQTRYGPQRGLDVDVETLLPGTTFQMPIKIEGYLFGDRAERELRFGKRKEWLLNLPRYARQVAGLRLADEIDFFRPRKDGQVVLGFYSRLVQTWDKLAENEFLLQVGWGTGWLSKTFGKLLQQDPEAFERLVSDYRMTMERGRKPGDPFPRSRHLVRRGEHPALPLGWVKITVERS